MSLWNDPTPRVGDTDNNLLSKISQLIATGGGVAGVGSISVNGGAPQQGAVSLTIPNGSDFLPLTGGSLSGGLSVIPAVDATALVAVTQLTGASISSVAGLSAVWNTSGAPTGLSVSVIDTASASASLLFDFRRDGASVLNLRKDGRLQLTGRISATTAATTHFLVVSDALTSTAPTGLTLQHNTSGTPAAGFGYMLDWNLDSSTTAGTLAHRMVATWTDVTHATRTAQLTLLNFVSGTLSTAAVFGNNQIQGNAGTAALPSFTNRSDVDTGLYFPTTNAMGLATSATLRLSVDTALVTSTLPLQLSNATTLGADPTNAGTHWATSGELFYRASAASEGAGQNNRIHNRSASQLGAGTAYTLTTSNADVVFGTTDATITLPTAGTYLVVVKASYVADSLGALDPVTILIRNQTDATFVDSEVMIAAAASGVEGVTLHAIVTITAAKTFGIQARNDTAARGQIIAARTRVTYLRMF